ncbi:MAG: MFS transporter, partial [Gammaproteobacteria bacterium]|nr:MFS transporter [Gammaproteobacteria bacterium]
IMDFFGPARAASAIAATATAILLAPMFAPTLGGLVIEWYGWRAVFALSGLLGGVVMLFAARKLVETKPPDPAAGASPRTLSSYRQLFSSRIYLSYVAFGSSLMSMIYTFVTGTPYVVVDVLGISPARLGLLLFFPAVASFAGFLVAARVVNRVGGRRLMQTGALLAFTGASSMAVLSLAGVWHPLALFIPGMLIGFANALATPSSTTAAITRHPAIAGAASGLMGFVHLVVAAGATQLVAFFANHSPVPLAATLMGLCLVSLLALRAIARMPVQSGP